MQVLKPIWVNRVLTVILVGMKLGKNQRLVFQKDQYSVGTGT
jgi:hypothetical protein